MNFRFYKVPATTSYYFNGNLCVFKRQVLLSSCPPYFCLLYAKEITNQEVQQVDYFYKKAMSYHNEVKAKAKEYNESIASIESKRLKWKETLKPLIIKIFNDIKDYSKGNAELLVQVNDGATNWESIFLSFSKVQSGIYIPEGKGGKHLIKFGGSLAFSLVYNGDIIIDIQYPYVQEVVDQNPHTWKKVNIDRIDEDFIYQESLKFLDLMIKWEKSDKNDIGFRPYA